MNQTDLTPGDLLCLDSRASISFYLVFSREPLQFVVVWKSGLHNFTAVWVRTSIQPGDPRLDAAYRVFYAAFNFGGLVALRKNLLD